VAYSSDSIATVINRLNVSYFLPAIQREFVWRPDQIISLFDSILRGYPISSFLFWELQPQNRNAWEAYRFLYDARQGVHAEIARTQGVPQLHLVLDGQQRLTSLLIGLRGSYTIRKPSEPRESPSAWVTQHLCLDLLKDARADEDGDTGVRYGFRFLDKERSARRERGHYWFNIGRILECDSEDRFYELRQRERDALARALKVTKEQGDTFDRNLDRLYRAVWRDQVIFYYTEREQDYDRVLDIFVRANEGGTKLSKSDLLLSMVTLQWGETNARAEIYSFVDRLNNDLARRNNFDKDFVLKTCLVLADLAVEYRVANFSTENLKLIHGRWEQIKAAIETTVELVNSFGIDRATLTSANALIPIIYYLYRHPGLKVRGTTPFDVRNAQATRRWTTMAMLNNVFSGQSDTLLRAARRIVQEQKGSGGTADFPAEALSAEFAKLGKPMRFDEAAIRRLLALTYGKKPTYLALSLLYDEDDWARRQYTQDHIFPRSLLTPQKLGALGLSQAKQRRYRALMNRIGNLELLLAAENFEKANQGFDTWLKTRDSGFRERHLIPADDGLLALDKFEEFVSAREQLIRARLKKLFAAG
jgi:hypothetical protein